MIDRQGIPDNVTLEFVREWVKPRVSEKRFKHIQGVVKVAKRLAERVDCDVFQAELAGWLHDACKEMKAHELVEQARHFYLALDPVLEIHGHLLHGPVAAEIAKRELGIGNREVLNAIAQHTLGGIDMSDLSKVLFLADCLDDTRPADYTKPIWEALDIDGACNLNAAIVMAADSGLQFLIAEGKPIHPKTVAVRNFYLEQAKDAARV